MYTEWWKHGVNAWSAHMEVSCSHSPRSHYFFVRAEDGISKANRNRIYKYSVCFLFSFSSSLSVWVYSFSVCFCWTRQTLTLWPTDADLLLQGGNPTELRRHHIATFTFFHQIPECKKKCVCVETQENCWNDALLLIINAFFSLILFKMQILRD